MSQSMTRHAPAQADDRRTLLRAKAGDRAAFGELYRRHHQAAWNMASGFTAHAELAVINGVAAALGPAPRRLRYGRPSCQATRSLIPMRDGRA